MAVRGDVASLSDLDALADRVKDDLGSVEGLFVNAGIAPLTPFESTTEEMYDELFAINVKGAFFTVQKLAPLLSTGAGVVLTTSIANVIGMRETSVYAAGKAALRSMARSLSRELLPRGIRVNAVSPGPIDTGILESTMTREAAEEFKAQRVADNPCGASVPPRRSPGRRRSSPSTPRTPPAPSSPWTGVPPSSDIRSGICSASRCTSSGSVSGGPRSRRRRPAVARSRWSGGRCVGGGLGPGLLAQEVEQGPLRRARAGSEHGDDGLGQGREHGAYEVFVAVGHR